METLEMIYLYVVLTDYAANRASPTHINNP